MVCTAHVKPLPEMSQFVDVILTAVAEPYCASVLDPVVPAEDRYIVSDVIAMVTLAAAMLINVMAVPIG